MPDSLLRDEDNKQLDELYGRLQQESDFCIGFPWNAKFTYSELYRVLEYPIKNNGDPFCKRLNHLNSQIFERESISIFAGLLEAPKSSHRGYVTGGTEGNLYGVFYACELLPDGISYCSEKNYALQRLLRSLGARGKIVRARKDGCIDIDHLNELRTENQHIPAIILANIGTILKGAIDDLSGIHQVLSEISIEKEYIHPDAVLSGMILPFLNMVLPWNFKAGIDRFSIGLHKMMGSPLPCSVVLTDHSRLSRFSSIKEKKSGIKSTIFASRNASSPIFIRYAFWTIGINRFKTRIKKCCATADNAIKKLAEIVLSTWRHRYSTTVVFDIPSESLTSRWLLFASGSTADIIAKPHISGVQIDRFVEDIRV